MGAHHRLAVGARALLRPGQADAGRDDQARITPADAVMKKVAEEMGVGQTFVSTPVGVFFGEPGGRGGDARSVLRRRGPERVQCIKCGRA